MNSTNRLLNLAVIVSLVATGESAIARQKGLESPDYGTRSQSNDIVNLAATEAIHSDLGVSEEVATKLTLLRDEYRAANQKAYRNAGLSPTLNPIRLTADQRQKHVEIGRRVDEEFFPKVKELLTADQNKRYQQVQFQYHLRDNGPRALLAPNVASELMLTNDQQQKLNGLDKEFRQPLVPPGTKVVPSQWGSTFERLVKKREEYKTKAIDVLSGEQKEILNRLKGKDFDFQRLGREAPPGKGD